VAGLRWILLGAGIALILGLWWWENRKARVTVAPALADPEGNERADVEPVLDVAYAEGAAPPEIDPEPVLAGAADRWRMPRRPPLIEIPDDLEVDVSDFVGLERRRSAEPDFSLEPEPAVDEPVVDAANDEPQAETDEADDHHRAPWVRTQPLERDEVVRRAVEEPYDVPASDPIERRTAEASRQRIVALRLIAPGAFWSGAALREALEAEGLSFGPYSIFHREREDGKSLCYVASMMEPGSFDIDHMDDGSFPGVSLFGVVPGPLDGPATFDLVLAVGRGLAERLKGQLQDEQGSTLTSQRILNLREELVHFEHRNRRLRRP
jgi:cell division protein ZipA